MMYWQCKNRAVLYCLSVISRALSPVKADNGGKISMWCKKSFVFMEIYFYFDNVDLLGEIALEE